MDRCPTEIIEQILRLACSDDGTTGRSLSLVSHYISQLSYPFHWHSLSLSGLAQTSSFASILQTQPPSQPPRPILHLFLSDLPASEAHDRWNRAQEGITIEDLYQKEESERKSWLVAQSAVLAYAAPTLQTFAFLSFDPRNSALRVAELLKSSFPLLTELTIRVPPLQPLYASPPIDLLNTAATSLATYDKRHLLPKLSHLHVVCDFRDFTAPRSRLRAISSHVTHLRLSGILKAPLAQKLHSELSERGIVPSVVYSPTSFTYTADRVTWDPLLPPSIQHLVMQPASPDYCKIWGFEDGEAVIHMLQALADEADNERFLVLSPRGKKSYGYTEAKEDWESRISGGGGCWEKREEEEEVQGEDDPEVEGEASGSEGWGGAPSPRTRARFLPTLFTNAIHTLDNFFTHR
ncbi:hypothetical protein JAAARDRAFT_189972 [Jaapia argillacea MUCL 33604]|uniref:Uncharacterized protein n=1 Tax=Jaapia argillacea MUCL 33604 TaxID=933084 RepID=A0A067Q921_9AGAM|nr:hypothetical protein JAAARDRAFT_189972 [Jaapia argillacea MUCL 33604]